MQGKGNIATERKKIKRHIIYVIGRLIPNRRNYMWTGREVNESEVRKENILLRDSCRPRPWRLTGKIYDR